MTDVLERAERPAFDRARASGNDRHRRPFDLSRPGRVLLATLSAAAGVIHLVMVPSHWGESVLEGVGFAVAGWFQLVMAVILVTRPSVAALRVTTLANLALIGTWAVSRTFGLPFGEHAWHAETASFVDLACVGIEAALVLAAGVLLFRPGLGRGWDHSRLAFGAVVPIGVMALATAAVASPSARDHALGSHGGHGQGHGHMAAAQSHHGDGDDRGLSTLQNGHQHGSSRVVELDDQTQAALASQLAQTATLVQQYPTIAAAEAAGYRRAGPFVPGLGTHFLNYGQVGGGAPDGTMDAESMLRPLLIYDGVGPDAPLAGFMYLQLRGDEPEGFVGPNDRWHYHTNTCIVYGADGAIEAPLGADRDVTQAQCNRVGGNLIEFTGYMVHVWTVPGYESERGVFSDINPAITCPDGTYYTKPVRDWGFSPNACRGE